MSPSPYKYCGSVYLVVFFLIVFAANCRTAHSQADVANSTLKGKVVDQTGAAVSGATVTLLSGERGQARTVKTDSGGSYRITLLQPGSYGLHVEAQGFQSQDLPSVLLTVGQIGVLDIHLQVSQIKETLNIPESTTLVETQRTQQSETIERSQVSRLPNLS